MNQINVRFLGNINDDDGKPLYPVIAAYPNQAAAFSNVPANYTPKQSPNLIYKH
jgi:hypothetical protein